MTVEQIMDDVWRAAGEPTDLDPDNDTRYSGSPLLLWVVNQAQNAIATWKDKDSGGKPKILEIYGEMFFQASYITGTLDADASSGSSIALPTADVGASDDQYVGWIYYDGSEYKTVTDYTGSTSTVTLDEALSTTPSSGDTYYLYKRFFYMLPSTDTWASEHITRPSSGTLYHGNGQFLIPTRIEDVSNKRKLEKDTRSEGFLGTSTEVGDPTSWFLFGNKVVMNIAPDDDRWFRMEYRRLPSTLTLSSQTPEIPEQFHYGLVLWSLEWVFRHYGETGDKYSTKLDFNDFMRGTISTMEMEYDPESDYVYLERRR